MRELCRQPDPLVAENAVLRLKRIREPPGRSHIHAHGEIPRQQIIRYSRSVQMWLSSIAASSRSTCQQRSALILNSQSHACRLYIGNLSQTADGRSGGSGGGSPGYRISDLH